MKKNILALLGLVLTFQLNAQVVKPDATNTVPVVSSTLPAVSHAGSTVNYVRSYDLYAPLTSMPVDDQQNTPFTDAINNGNIMQATQYFDGLGRPVQTVARKASGAGHDMVTFMVYDEYGRQVYQPMPYVATGTSDGRMQLSPTAGQSTFLGNHYSGENIFYSKTEFEASPLNRALKVTGAGNKWTDQNKGVNTQYLTNTTSHTQQILANT